MDERPPIWRVAANVLNKQLWTANKGSSSTWVFGKVLTTPRCKNWPCYETDACASNLG